MTLIAAVLGGGLGLGVWLVGTGLSRWAEASPTPGWRVRPPADLRIRCARAGLLALLAGVVTRWPVAAVAGGAIGWWWTELVGTRSARNNELARTEAIATWTEMLRDTLAGAHGLEQAIMATQPQAPEAIRREVTTLAARAERQSLAGALAEFGVELAHPVGDLVVTALHRAAEGAVSDLTELLGSLASIARDEAAMRLKVDAERARLRTAVHVIAACTLATVAGLVVLNPSYLSAYRDPLGQAVLAGIAVGAGLALWWLGSMSRFAAPERFLVGSHANLAERP
jgi:Flp pilus assembly protein TadB